MVCGDLMPIPPSGFAIPIPLMLQVCFAMAQDLAQIVDFPTRIPHHDDHQPYLLDLSSNPDSCIVVASYPPSGNLTVW